MSIFFDGNSEGVQMVVTDSPPITYIPKPEWISVDERLPEEGKWVLVWYEYFAYGDVNAMVEDYGIAFQYKGFWSGDVQGTRAKCLYWRYLPDAPIGSRRRYDQT